MASIDRASPALKEILLKLYRAEKPMEIDHNLYEFGSVEYHIQCQACNPLVTYLSISSPPVWEEAMSPNRLSDHTIERVKGLCPGVVDIVEPPKDGYLHTLRLNFNHIPRGKDCDRVITEISRVQSVIVCSQLKEMLQNVDSRDAVHGVYNPIKLVYHPREPFFVIKQPQRTIAVFPMRFKEKSDLIIATAFFQELVDVGCSDDKWAKAPSCSWSAIPPPELMGEAFEDLSTNGGFVSFDIPSRHFEGKRIDNTVWNLLNFNAYVRHHVKTTKGFIQRKMRKRLESLVQVLHGTGSTEDEKNMEEEERRLLKKVTKPSKYNILKRRYGNFTRKMMTFRSRLRIRGFPRFRQQWLTFSKFYSKGHKKLM